MYSEYFEEDEDESNDCPDWHSEFIAEVDEAIDLAACVEVDFDERVVPVEIEQLLEQQGGGDFGFLVGKDLQRVWMGLGCGYFSDG